MLRVDVMCCMGLAFATWHALWSLLMGACTHFPELHSLPCSRQSEEEAPCVFHG